MTRPAVPMRPHSFHQQDAAKQIRLPVQPVEAAHVARKVNAAKLVHRHSLSKRAGLAAV
jgi:hypothetical protein